MNLERTWNKAAAPLTLVATLALGASILVSAPAPDYPTGVDCANRLSNPAPLTTPDREFLERCVHAFTLPTTLPTVSPTPTTLPTTPPMTGPPSTSPPVTDFPTPSTTGVPAGWVPVQTRSTDLRVTTAGAVIQDIRFVNANLIVDAANVTVRRVEFQGGRVDNRTVAMCRNGMLLEDVSFIRAPGQVTRATDQPAVNTGGYTARRVEINGLPEGFRVGGRSSGGCGPVTIENSFARVVSPDICGDWHGDAVQGYDGPSLTARNNTLILEENGCGGTAPFFYPRNQGNTSAFIDRLLVSGGGFSFRNGMAGTVTGLRIDTNWGYGPIDVRCSVITNWEARIVDMAPNYTFVDRGPRSCNTESGY